MSKPKQVYRCIITVTDERCKEPAVSHAFYRTDWTPEYVKAYALKQYREILKNAGIYPPDLEIQVEVRLSSEEEIEAHMQSMKKGERFRHVN
jgi:hypothetical protein